ncbi:MAG: hypothetical protein FWG65_10255 [Turicibacter sp.]|nr:hypothetical protein [Turicibacter sp.]
MNFQDLTMDADLMLCELYKLYLERRKDGTFKVDAKSFATHEIAESIFPDLLVPDVHETLRELARADYLHLIEASGQVLQFTLAEKGIIYQESRFRRDLKKLVDFILKLRGFMIFIV